MNISQKFFVSTWKLKKLLYKKANKPVKFLKFQKNRSQFAICYTHFHTYFALAVPFFVGMLTQACAS